MTAAVVAILVGGCPMAVPKLAYWAKDKLIPAKGRLNGWICRDSSSGKALPFEL